MDWTPMFPIKIAIKWVVNPPIFQTHLYNSIYQCWWYMPSHSPKYPLWSSQITQFNYLSVALPPTLEDYPNPRRGRKPRVLLHHHIGNLRVSCRQLLLVSMSSQFLWWTEPRKLSIELPRHLPMAPFPPGLTGSLPSPQVWVPPWLAQLSQPSQAPEKDRLHDVSRDLGLFNKPCRQSTQLAYGSRLLLPHETSKLRN